MIHSVVAPLVGDIGAYHHAFLNWTWSGGSQTLQNLSVTSDYNDGFPPAPVIVYDANYGRCAVQQPSTGNTLTAVENAGRADMTWGNAGGESDGYRVYRSTVPGPRGVFTAVFETTGLTWLDAGGGGTGSDYYYNVVAYCGSATPPSHTHEGPWGTLVAEFSSSAPGCDGTGNVSFTNLTNGGAPPYSYLWDFGDGTTSTATNPVHTYALPPYIHTVTLTATDSDVPVPKTSQASHNVGAGAPVGAAFTYTKSDVTAFFTGIPSGGTGSYQFSWDFGDGVGTSTAQSPTYTYAAAGTYTVSFTVSDLLSGCSASVSQPVTVP